MNSTGLFCEAVRQLFLDSPNFCAIFFATGQLGGSVGKEAVARTLFHLLYCCTALTRVGFSFVRRSERKSSWLSTPCFSFASINSWAWLRMEACRDLHKNMKDQLHLHLFIKTAWWQDYLPAAALPPNPCTRHCKSLEMHYNKHLLRL